MTIKVLIVGCGIIAGSKSLPELETHAGVISQSKNFSLKSCVDICESNAKHLADKFDCAFSTNLENVLNNQYFDLISVCSPDDTHYDIVKYILCSRNRPKVIFLEKPAFKSIAEYDEIKKLAFQEDVLIVVNHSRRFNRFFSDFRDFIKSQKFGNLIKINTVYYNGWFHNGSHIIDTISLLTSDQIDLSSLVSVIELSESNNDHTLEFVGALKKSNVPIYISAINQRYYQLFDFDFWFEKGRVRIEDFHSKIIFQEKSINRIGESVLIPYDFPFLKSKFTEMQVAYNKISSYFNLNHSKILYSASLENIGDTMKTLSQGLELYKRKVTNYET